MENLRSGYLFPEVSVASKTLLVNKILAHLPCSSSVSYPADTLAWTWFHALNLLNLMEPEYNSCHLSSWLYGLCTLLLTYYNDYQLNLNQICSREFEHTKKYPHERLIRLGVGDTTESIPGIITAAMAEVT